MRALVTGGGGFLGRHIVERLLKRGAYVRVLARGHYPELAALGVDCHKGSITSMADVQKACEGIDTVFHVAAYVNVSGRYQQSYDTNVLGTQRIVECCKNLGIQKLIFTSSSSVVYAGKNIIKGNETLPYPKKFHNNYAKTKAESERHVLEANGKDGLLTVALRPHLIFGPRDPYLIPSIIKKAKRGELRQIGSGKNMTDITYVENCAEAHLMAADHLKPGAPLCGQAYFITQGEPMNLWSWVNHILGKVGQPPIKKKVPFWIAYMLGAILEDFYKAFLPNKEPPISRIVALHLATSHTYSIEKAKRDFGYAPTISTEAGLEKTIRYFKRS